MIPAHAFIDESGQRSMSAASSDHFVMSAVVIRDHDLPEVAAKHAALRQHLGRRPGDHLTWKNLKNHGLRLKAAQSLNDMPLTIMSVVIAKRTMPAGAFATEDRLYLYALRLLLERLSWWGRDERVQVNYTLAHIIRFKKETLREYEETLRNQQDCTVQWGFLDPLGGRLDQPTRCEQLQLADIAASATAAGFEPDPFGNTEPRYVREFSPSLYRRPSGSLLSYGLKVMAGPGHSTKSAYPWVADL